MSPVNVLVMIHGMTPDPQPKSPFDNSNDGKYWGYNTFFDELCKKQNQLTGLFPNRFIGVEWGHELPEEEGKPSNSLQEDHQLTRAQNFINERIAYDILAKDADPNNITMSLFSKSGIDFPTLTPLVRWLVVGLRESIATRGLGDVLYYGSAQGECIVRRSVYKQVLERLEPYLDESDVRIHLIGQSLGVTLTHDFLYGLFNPNEDYIPGFYVQGDEVNVARFKKWRQKAQTQELKLGSLTSTASQLPLFSMRNQVLVNRLANRQLFDARDIGILDSNQIQWQLFYDLDDLLGFGTRRLYSCGNAIREYQVDTGDNPGDAHTSYWKNFTVIEKTAELLLKNSVLS
ncbi:MAG: hypothetical protein HC852_02905 [Acaryochloridaceae cyanobacterium RU_4_10]|nr:hypothetical protein [Acaryochloridaceae cyanobacterium RU_4_10]